MKSEPKALYDLATWKNGLAFRQIHFSEKGKPIIKIAELKNGLTGQTQYTEDTFAADVALTRGDMVFSWSGNPDTSIDVFWYDLPDGWLNQHIFKITPAKGVYKYYLYYLLKLLKPVFTTIASNKQTTGLGHVTVKDLKEIVVDLPSYEVQVAVGDYLRAIDEKIHINNTINDNLEQQAQALFSSYYERSIETVNFTSLVDILGGGTPKTSEGNFWNGDIPFFTPKDVGMPYTLATEKAITQIGLDHCNSRLYPVNTVFVTARGTVGKVGLSGVPMAMNQSCYALVGKGIEQLLVYFYTLKTISALKHKASGAVFDAITTRDFDAEMINKLSDADTKAFIDTIKPIYDSILNNSIENQRLTALRDSLLPKLMSGEIDVSEVRI